MSADGSNQTRLTNDPGWDLSSSFSADGQKIAFLSSRDGNGEVYSMSADGSGQTRLTNNPAFDGWPAFSPDSSKIAFDSNRDGNDEIYSMNADGSGQARLTNAAGVDSYPELGGAGLDSAGDHHRLRPLGTDLQSDPYLYLSLIRGRIEVRMLDRGRELRALLGSGREPHAPRTASRGPSELPGSGHRPRRQHRRHPRHPQLHRRHPGPECTEPHRHLSDLSGQRQQP